MKKSLIKPLFFCALAFAVPVFANFTSADSAKAKASCGGSFIGTTVLVENQSENEASSKAKAEIVSNIVSQVKHVIDTKDSSKEEGGIFKESSSYSATSQIKSDLILFGFQSIEYLKRLENGLYELKGYVCNSNAAKPYLDSLNKYNDLLEVFLKQELDEEICISASEAKYKMLGWQRILETLDQVDKTLQGKYENANEKLKNDCSEISKRQTVVVVAKGTEPKGSNALKNLERYVVEALVNSSLYSKVEEGHDAKFKCEVEIAPSYSSYMLTAKIIKVSNGETMHNRMVNVVSNLKTEAEHRNASIGLVSQLLKRCGTMSVGEVYEGECKNGKRDGKGKLTFLSGDVYEGGWKEDEPNGEGEFKAMDGSGYKGGWKSGKFHGQGKLTQSDGYVYEGGWLDDVPSGKGKEKKTNGDFYDGNFKNGKYDGQGTYIWADSVMIYSGIWENGSWKNGTLSQNGMVYNGDFKNGSFDGQGTLTFPDKEFYKGTFKNGNFEGQGLLTTAKGDVYNGNFKNGMGFGLGKYTYANGDVYEGEFKNSLPEGLGKLTYKEGGIVQKGEFKKGDCVAKCVLIAKFKDTRDNKIYKMISINSQIWLAENLNYKMEGSKCYDNKPANCDKYGRLYNWETAMKACPSGWHLPSQAEYGALLQATESLAEFSKLKAEKSWGSDKSSDDYSFSALPGGFYSDSFKFMGTAGIWWTSTEKAEDKNKSTILWVFADNAAAERPDGSKSNSFSVRCLKDSESYVPPPVAAPTPPAPPATAPAPAPVPAPAPASTSSFKDSRNNKTYKTVKIGEHTWMAENLNYNASGSRCYENKPANCDKYGKLYNWNTAKTACPSGWHLPNNAEWDALYRFVDGASGTASPYYSKTAGKSLKAANGFAALPGGLGASDGDGQGGSSGIFWSSSEDKGNSAYIRFISSENDYANGTSFDKSYLLSVRCVKDSESHVATPVVAPSAQPVPTPVPVPVPVPTPAPAPTPSQPVAHAPASASSFKDSRDNKTYKMVKIGTQTWMAENLNYNASSSKCYDGKSANCDKHGKLYNWNTAKTACPSGWHLPSNAEWDALYRFVDGASGTASPYYSKTAGKSLKAASGWNNHEGKSGNGTDAHGFSALPGGLGASDRDGQGGVSGVFWSSSEDKGNSAYIRFMNSENDHANGTSLDKGYLISVRCVKDSESSVAPPAVVPPVQPAPAPAPTPAPAPAPTPVPAPVQPAPATAPVAPVVAAPASTVVVPPASTATVPTSVPANTPDNSAKPASVEKSTVLKYVLSSLMLVGGVVLLYNAYDQYAKANDYMDEYDHLSSGKPMEYNSLKKKVNDADDKVPPFLISGGVLGISAVGVYIWF